jgi:hypothetical protein
MAHPVHTRILKLLKFCFLSCFYKLANKKVYLRQLNTCRNLQLVTDNLQVDTNFEESGLPTFIGVDSLTW